MEMGKRVERKTKRYEFPRKWTENIRMLGCQEFPYYLIIGENACAIVEGGVSALAPKVLKEFEALNLPAPLKHLVIAHAHTDHVTGLMRLKRMQPDFALTGSSDSEYILGKEKVVGNFIAEDAVYNEFMVREGIVEEVPEMLPVEPVEFDIIVNDDSIIDLGGVEMHFVSTPGHAPGATAVFVMPDNVLLISDSVGYGETEDDVFPLFFHNYSWFVESLEKLKALNPENIGLGHNLTIEGRERSRAFLDLAISESRSLKKEIDDKTASGVSSEELAYELAKRLANYGLFGYFPLDTLAGFTALIVRRALAMHSMV